jgi:hypothetical protein
VVIRKEIENKKGGPSIKARLLLLDGIKLSPDHFFCDHFVHEVEHKLPLGRACVGNTATMKISLTANEKFKCHLVTGDFDCQIKRPMFLMTLLCLGKQIRREWEPVQADHRALFEASFEVGVDIVQLHGRELINYYLSHDLISFYKIAGEYIPHKRSFWL